MEELRTDIVFFEELTPERRAEVRAAIGDDPELVRTFVRWRQVRAALRERIDARVPDRQLLVLYALDDAGHGDVLDADERAALEDARASIEAALAQHPGLGDVVERIQDDQTAFESAWSAHTAAAGAPSREPARADRAPRPSYAQRAASTRRRWGWRAAALAVVALIAMVSVMVFSGEDRRTVVATGETDVQQVSLPDGSTVRLMAQSRLEYDRPDAAASFDRTVTLSEGRAFFDVAGASQRFVVETPTARTTALGTSFGVQVRGQETEVVLASGRVQVASRTDATQAVTLQPGQTSRVGSNAAPSTPSSVDVADALAWTGLFVFRDAPVPVIAERLTQHYQAEVSVAPVLRDQAVTGTFERTRPLDEIVRTIAATLGAQVERTDAGYRIAPHDAS